MGRCFAGTARQSENGTSIDMAIVALLGVEVEELLLDVTYRYQIVLSSTVCNLFPRRFNSGGIGEISRNRISRQLQS